MTTPEPGARSQEPETWHAGAEETKIAGGFSSFVFPGLVREVRFLAALLFERQLWLILALGLILWSLAYQIPYSFELNFGGDRTTGRRYDDQQFITGWNDQPEPTDDVWLTAKRNQAPFRWAYNQAALKLPGIGHGTWQVALLAAGQPLDQPTTSVWSDGVISSTLLLTQRPRLYQHIFTTDQHGDLALHFTTPAYTPAGDPRPLGFVGFRASVRSVGAQLPPWNQIGALLVITTVIYALARRFGAPRRWATLGSIAVVLLCTLLLASWRIPLTSFAPTLGWLAFGCFPLSLVLLRIWELGATVSSDPASDPRPLTPDPRLASAPRPLIPDPWYRPAIQPQSLRVEHVQPLVALIVLGFALRLGGMLHPQLMFSDIGLNANNLLALIGGAVYQTEGLPVRAGGGESPYPPGQYIIAAPVQVLVGSAVGDAAIKAQLSTLLKIVNALLDSMGIGLIWLVLRRCQFSQAAALFAAALYVAPGPAFKSLGVGEFANIAGQSLALPLLVALPLLGRRQREGRFTFVGVLMLLALLGHSGVTISVVLLLGVLVLIWLVNPATRQYALSLLLLGTVVGVLVGLFYHSAFLHLFVGSERAAQAASVLPTLSFGTKLLNEFRRAFFAPFAPTSPLLLGVGVLGLVALARQPRTASSPLLPLVLAWWGSVLLTLGLLAVRDQTVRWDLFLYPALCLSAGPLLAAIFGHGRLGKAVALLVAGALVAYGVVFWALLIANQYHV